MLEKILSLNSAQKYHGIELPELPDKINNFFFIYFFQKFLKIKGNAGNKFIFDS